MSNEQTDGDQSSRHYYMGIDPGKSGGAVVVNRAKIVMMSPFHNKTVADIWEFFWSWSPLSRLRVERDDKIFALIEKVHSWPAARRPFKCPSCNFVQILPQAQGVKSAFTFGANKGHLEMALAAAGISNSEMGPALWQRKMGVPKKAKGETKTSHKNKMKGMAQRLYPGAKITLAVADAVLLAELCKTTKG